MDAITKILRRLSSRALNDAEQKEDTDQLVGMLGVTSNVAAQLGAGGIESVQQMANVDPVSLALRTGLSFDYILNLVSQSQAWCFIGTTARALAPLGLGDARVIAALVDSIGAGDQKADAALNAVAKKIAIDPDLLLFNFKNIAADEYTIFLRQF